MEVQVEILIQTITAQYGTLNPGDTLRTNEAYAAHLVYDCGAAVYCEPRPPKAAAAAAMLLPATVAVEDNDVQTSAQEIASAGESAPALEPGTGVTVMASEDAPAATSPTQAKKPRKSAAAPTPAGDA
ncbi:hypothetical protein IP91_02583 [Pseudoduganella lurida]|uniref:Uncharacterized protein n=1 Tax=Pseudoduganella lurida TaxID=1036180 RepID=A0A562R9W8_9BURK|nr:hypothetical protein [Pseudoduganella lurida]TWI65176.1 hypothetical protein IP91_02583 [Pseudoduganella lurida]